MLLQSKNDATSNNSGLNLILRSGHEWKSQSGLPLDGDISGHTKHNRKEVLFQHLQDI
jgi:hypothetical protein